MLKETKPTSAPEASSSKSGVSLALVLAAGLFTDSLSFGAESSGARLPGSAGPQSALANQNRASIAPAQSVEHSVAELIEQLRGSPVKPITSKRIEWGVHSLETAEALDSPQNIQARCAFNQLVERGKQIIPDLLRSLADPQAGLDQRVAIVGVLGVLSEAQSLASLQTLASARSTAPDLRRACLQALPGIMLGEEGRYQEQAIGTKAFLEIAAAHIKGELTLDPESRLTLFQTLSTIETLPQGAINAAKLALEHKDLPLALRIEAAAGLTLMAVAGHADPAETRALLAQLWAEAEAQSALSGKLVLATAKLGGQVSARLLTDLLLNSTPATDDLTHCAAVAGLGEIARHQGVASAQVLAVYRQLLESKNIAGEGLRPLTESMAQHTLASCLQLSEPASLALVLKQLNPSSAYAPAAAKALKENSALTELRAEQPQVTAAATSFLVASTSQYFNSPRSPQAYAALLAACELCAEYPAPAALNDLKKVLEADRGVNNPQSMAVKAQALRAIAAIVPSLEGESARMLAGAVVAAGAGGVSSSQASMAGGLGLATGIPSFSAGLVSPSVSASASEGLTTAAAIALAERGQEVPTQMLYAALQSVDLKAKESAPLIRALAWQRTAEAIGMLSKIAGDISLWTETRVLACESLGQMLQGLERDGALRATPGSPGSIRSMQDVLFAAAEAQLLSFSQSAAPPIKAAALSALISLQGTHASEVRQLIALSENNLLREKVIEALLRSPSPHASSFIYDELCRVEYQPTRASIGKYFAASFDGENRILDFAKKLEALAASDPARRDALEQYVNALRRSQQPEINFTHVANIPAQYLAQVLEHRPRPGQEHVLFFMSKADHNQALAHDCFGIHQLISMGYHVSVFELQFDSQPHSTNQLKSSFLEAVKEATRDPKSGAILPAAAVILSFHHDAQGGGLSDSHHYRDPAQRDQRSLDSSDAQILEQIALYLKQNAHFFISGCNSAGPRQLPDQPTLFEVACGALPKVHLVGTQGVGSFYRFTFDQNNKLTGMQFSVPTIAVPAGMRAGKEP